jgi:hypothetical protein
MRYEDERWPTFAAEAAIEYWRSTDVAKSTNDVRTVMTDARDCDSSFDSMPSDGDWKQAMKSSWQLSSRLIHQPKTGKTV